MSVLYYFQQIQIQYLTFDTEAAFDEVVVKDGSMELQKVSGNYIPGTVRSRGTALLLKFHSDYSRVREGFSLNIEFLEAQPNYGMFLMGVLQDKNISNL